MISIPPLEWTEPNKRGYSFSECPVLGKFSVHVWELRGEPQYSWRNKFRYNPFLDDLKTIEEAKIQAEDWRNKHLEHCRLVANRMKKVFL